MSDKPIEPDDDFEAMLEESFRREAKPLKVGDKVRALVVQVGRQNLILDLGEGRDGLMDLAELASAKEPIEAREGDEIEGWVVKVTDRVAEVCLTLDRAFQSRAGLEEAMASGLPVACSRLPALKEVGGDAVALADPANEPEFAALLRAILTEPERAARQARLGLERARSLTWRASAEATAAILRSVARPPA